MTSVNLPTPENNSGKAEWSEVYDNDKALREVVNGGIDNANIAAEAGITDAKLASPNNAAYRLLCHSHLSLASDAAAGTYPLQAYSPEPANPKVSGGNVINAGLPFSLPAFLYFDDADYTVGSKTQKLRLRAQVACNATKAAIKFTFGLYPITVAGAADTLTVTLGTVVSSSTVEINEPAASTVTGAVNSDFTIPSDGAYALGVVTSATLTNNSAVLLSAQLQTRSV